LKEKMSILIFSFNSGEKRLLYSPFLSRKRDV